MIDKKKRNVWFDEECKNERKKKLQVPNQQNAEIYREQRKKTKKILRRKKKTTNEKRIRLNRERNYDKKIQKILPDDFTTKGFPASSTQLKTKEEEHSQAEKKLENDGLNI